MVFDCRATYSSNDADFAGTGFNLSVGRRPLGPTGHTRKFEAGLVRASGQETLGLTGGWITAGTLPDAALFGAGGFGSILGIGGSLLDSIYSLSQLTGSESRCGS